MQISKSRARLNSGFAVTLNCFLIRWLNLGVRDLGGGLLIHLGLLAQTDFRFFCLR
jgi:hypothetical protein